MGNFSNNSITDKGRLLLADVQAGAVFTPTRIVIGAGSLPNTVTTQTITDVIAPIKSLAINKKKRSNDGKCTFGGAYTNEDITADFYFRELALYAKAVYLNEDGTVKSEVAEVLYSYGNAGDTADLMPAYSASTVVEKQIDLVVWIGNNAQVDLTIESGIYVTQEYFNETAVKKSGDTIKGNLFVERPAFPQIIVRDTTQQRDGFFQYAENGLLFLQNVRSNGNGNERTIIILGNESSSDAELLRVAKIVNGIWQTSKVYHENNKPTPEDIGALKSLTLKPHGIGFDQETAEVYLTIDGLKYNIPIGVGRNEVYHTGHKPTPAEIGAAPAVESADFHGCYYRTVNGEVEWINPPMVDGVEYRTTKRYKGVAVYEKVDTNGNIIWRAANETSWHLSASSSSVANATVE